MKSDSWDIKAICLMLIGLLYPVSIRIMGIIRIGEIVSILLGIYLMIKYWHKYIQIKPVKILITLYLLALFVIPVNDWINGVSADNFLKGFVSFGFLLPFFFVGLWTLFDNISRIKYFVVANVIGYWIVEMFFPMYSYNMLVYNDLEYVSIAERFNIERDLFAYQYAPIVLAILCLVYKRWQRLIAVLLLFIAVFFLYGGSRNLFLTYGIASMVLFFIGRIDEKNKYEKIELMRKKMMRFVLSLSMISVVLFALYPYMARNGLLGEYAQWKYEYQKGISENMLKSGREPVFIAMHAISKEPIFGYGSMAQDKYGICDEYARENNTYNFLSRKDLIPSHSHILQYWLWYGFLTLPFWLYVIYSLIYAFFRSLCYKPDMVAYMTVSIISFLWHIFFSPYQDRLTLALIIISVISLNYSVKRITPYLEMKKQYSI